MQFKQYLELTKTSPTAFARKHGLPIVTVWRVSKGVPVSPRTARRVSDATDRAVSILEILFPDGMP